MTQGERAATVPAGTVESKGLRGGALGLMSSVVVGVASTAPAYSLAATLGLVVAGGGALLAGVKAPAILVIAFVPMYLIAVAYQELNNAEPDCGTTFTWASRAFGPIAGWLGGWGVVAADVIVIANLAAIAGRYSFSFAADLGWHGAATLAASVVWSTVAGVAWIVLMTYVCYRGIEASARLQYVLLAVEIIVLAALSIVALVKVYTHNAGPHSLRPSLSWFWPGDLDFGSVIAPALLIATFIYWGWDTVVACNEESEDPGSTPGRAAVLSTFVLLGTYALVTVAVVAFAGVGTEGTGLGNPRNSKDVFVAIGPTLFGDGVFGRIGLLLLAASILTSASASTLTTILPAARTTLSMGFYQALPKKFTVVHPRNLTPAVSTIVVGAASLVCYVLFTAVSPDLLEALIGCVGLMIAFYSALTGFACFWYYRKTLTRSARDFVMRGLFPLLGGVSLTVIFGYALFYYSKPTWLIDEEGNYVTIAGFGAVGVVGIVALLLGVVLMVVWWVMAPIFFQGSTLPRRSAEPDDDESGESDAYPAAPEVGVGPTRSAPVLSNEPPQ
jgi:amino acid transporter